MTDRRAGEGIAPPRPVLEIDRITRRFGPLVANDAISLTLNQGEILGLLGENGAGKTTLMNILFGHYVADEGEIRVDGAVLPPGEPKAALAAGIGMVHQHFTLAENLSVLDNIILGTESLWRLRSNLAAARARIRALSADYGLAVDADAQVSALSVGERQRVEILKALYRNARILILDEPTAVLTPQESAALFETLKKFVGDGLSIIFISHKLGEIMEACSRVAILRGGKLVAERKVYAITREELAELMVGRPIPSPKAEPQDVNGPALVLRSLSARRASQALHSVNLTVNGGEIVGIAGVSGNGQVLLADCISGTWAPSGGGLELAGKEVSSLSPRLAVEHGIARIPEDRHAEGMISGMSITENVIAERYHTSDYCRHGLIDWRKARNFAGTIIKGYDVKCPGPDARAGLLSGGNMQKLILGRVMSGNPRLILANQPTRGLDVGAVAYVHEQLLAARKAGAGILLISEDLDELLALSDRMGVMFAGQLSALLPRVDLNIPSLGLMMAGQGFVHAA